MFDEATLKQLSKAVASEVVSQLSTPLTAQDQHSDRWMDAKQAADYLGMTVTALHKLTAADAIPHTQAAPNAKLYFQRSQLDSWRLENAQGPVP